MSYTRQMYGVKDMRVMRFLIQETGTFDEQYRRPFQTGLDGQSHAQIMETVASSHKITAAALAGVANNFIKPAATPESLVQIPQGWATKRLRFMLEIQTTDRVGFTTVETITGYTDHAGLSMYNSIDQNMVFFINNVNVTRTNTVHTPLGNQSYQSLVDASHVLVNDAYTGITVPQKTYGLRPEDVYTQIDNATMQQEIGNEMLLDGRSIITTNSKLSRRTNAIAPVYVASVLDSYRQSSQGSWDASQSHLMETAGASVASEEARSDPFLAFLRSRSAAQTSHTFTYGDLVALDPNVASVTKVDPVSHGMASGLSYTGLSANWAATDYTTQFAAILAQSVPGYMLSYCLNKIHIRSTNLDIGGRMSTAFQRAPGSLNRGMDISPQISAFIFRLENELLKDLSYNGQMGFSFDLICDLMGETRITLSLNGQPEMLYVAPSFCDALLAPVVTNDIHVLGQIANDFGNLMRDMEDNKLVGSGATGSLGHL